MTDIQKKILELMKDGEPLKKYSRVCYVGEVNFNANSVKSLIKNGILEFYLHDNANDWDYYKVSEYGKFKNPNDYSGVFDNTKLSIHSPVKINKRL